MSQHHSHRRSSCHEAVGITEPAGSPRSTGRRCSARALALFFTLVTTLAALGTLSPVWASPMGPEASKFDERGLIPAVAPLSIPVSAEGCDGPLVADDGTVETGFGWVPSVLDGIYVQRFEGGMLDDAVLQDVCICWLRTRDDATIDFQVVAYEAVLPADAEPGDPLVPRDAPYVSIPASARVDAKGVAAAQFTRIEVDGLRVPRGPFFLGVRWNPSADSFFFVCADTSPGGARAPLYLRDDRSGGWTSALSTTDPIFDEYQATFIRPIPGALPTAADIPMQGSWSMMLLAAFFAALGLLAIRR